MKPFENNVSYTYQHIVGVFEKPQLNILFIMIEMSFSFT